MTHEPARRTFGSTMIDFLVVFAFIAVVTAAAVDRFAAAGTRDMDAGIAAPKADQTAWADVLRALAAEETVLSARGAYRSFAVGPGGQADGLGFEASPGVAVSARVEDGIVVVTGRHRDSDRTWCASSRDRLVVNATTC